MGRTRVSDELFNNLLQRREGGRTRVSDELFDNLLQRREGDSFLGRAKVPFFGNLPTETAAKTNFFQPREKRRKTGMFLDGKAGKTGRFRINGSRPFSAKIRSVKKQGAFFYYFKQNGAKCQEKRLFLFPFYVFL